MRIDDDNKIVWCSEELADWKNSFNEAYDPLTNQLYSLARVGFGWGLTDCRDKDISFCVWDHTKQKELMLALLNGYEFKIEQKKYYWRKKKEHLAQFEDFNMNYLNAGKDGYLPLCLHECDGTRIHETKFTEQEARELLKDDFNMFEKVECDHTC